MIRTTHNLARRLSNCIFLLPVLLVPTVFTSFNTNTIVMKETILQFCVLLSIAAMPLLWHSDRQEKTQGSLRRSPRLIVGVLALLGLYLAISAVWISPHPRSTHAFLRWLSYILLTVISIPYAANRQRFQSYLTVTILTASAIGLYAIGQSFEIDYFYKDWSKFPFGVEGVRRVCGSMGNPDYLAGYLVALIPLTVILSLVYTEKRRILFLIASIVELLALIFTYSRGAEAALLATAFALLLSFIVLWWKNKPLLRSIASRKSAFVIFIFAVVTGLCTCAAMWDKIYLSISRIGQLGKDVSTLTRPMYWKGTLDMWATRPISGVGVGAFPLKFPEYRPQQLAAYQSFKDFYVEHAHNEFLEILAETGIVGFILYASFVVLLTLSIWRILLTTKTRENLCLLGLWGGILGTLIHNCFTVTLRFTPSAFLFWSFSGVSLGYILSVSPRPLLAVSWKRRLSYALLLAFVPYLFVSAVKNYVGDYQIRQAKVWLSELNPEESERYNRETLEKILTALYTGNDLAPDCVEGHFLLGLAYHKVYDYPQAIQAYERLETLQKDFTSNRLNLGISCMKQSDLVGGQTFLSRITLPFPLLAADCLQEAADWLKKALESDPEAPDYHHFLGRTYYYLGDMQAAEKELLDALKFSERRPFEYIDAVNPSPDIHAYLGRIYFYQGQYEKAERSFRQSLQELQQRTYESTIYANEHNTAHARDLTVEIKKYLTEIAQKRSQQK